MFASHRDTFNNRRISRRYNPRKPEACCGIEIPEFLFRSLATAQQNEHGEVEPLCEIGLIGWLDHGFDHICVVTA
jgi:hypothetical protein